MTPFDSTDGGGTDGGKTDEFLRHGLDHLFRHESGKMAAALTRILGVHNLDLAEDIVQETLCRAVEVWRFHPLPDNPSAWLMHAAKNRAIDVIRRERTSRRFASDISDLLSTEWALSSTVAALFEQHEIRDDQLRMMFSCCHPSLKPEAHIALILKILCGFSTCEIASAFMASEANIEKRVTRAKNVLRASGTLFEVAGVDAIERRLSSVHHALYLLFNEGYHSSHPEHAVREELCYEALRLALLLSDHPAVPAAETRALVALMCLHAARLGARVDAQGQFVMLEQQDRRSWSWPLIEKGLTYLAASEPERELSAYHVEAAIAAKHCEAERFEDTDWQGIVELYDVLMQCSPSPVVALNRAIAIGLARGPEHGLAALVPLEGEAHLSRHPFLDAARAELQRRAGQHDAASVSYRHAIDKARTAAERQFFEQRLLERSRPALATPRRLGSGC